PRRAIVRQDRRRPFHHSWHAAAAVARCAADTRAAARMIRIALTGSIGMGKSTVARMFERAGVPVFDADAEVRALQGPGGALVERIEKRFPGTTRDGAVDRDALSIRVLGDPDELAALEALVHPAVHHERTRFI